MSRRGRCRIVLAAAALTGSLLGPQLGCGAGDVAPTAPKPAGSGKAPKGVAMVTPSWLIPELDPRSLRPWSNDPDQNKYLIGGLRVVVHTDGRVERAAERFPTGNVNAVAMPPRFGGGFLFYQADNGGTRTWRAPSWIGALEPLSLINPEARDIVPGLDRLYVRTPREGVVALDPADGRPMSRGPLPVASAWGAMAFADGWRGVVDTELRGPLVTFDAGSTWLPLPIDGRVDSAGVFEGDPVIYATSGSFRVDASGQVHRIRDGSPGARLVEDPEEPEAVTHPLGKHPLRRVIEHGWPLAARKALVLYRGALSRVALPTGVVEAHRPDAIDDDEADCTASKVGGGFGFVCGVEDGATTIYRYREPLALDVVVTFAKPRFVSSSGNGAFAVRGACGDEKASDEETRLYCIVGRDGHTHEIAVRGELGAERVVALGDERVVVLVPPRLDRPGRVTVIDGDKLHSKELSYPTDQDDAAAVARSGLWLDGFEERDGGKIGGWVEAGGPTVGVEIELKTGKVALGPVQDQGGYVLTAGRFGLAVTDVETARETFDGGITWTELEMPRLAVSRRSDVRSRGCSPVGCAMQGWLRIGWGDPAQDKDLEVVAAPPSQAVKSLARRRSSATCKITRWPSVSPKTPPVAGETPYTGWSDFRGVAPPRLAKDEQGVDKASPYGSDSAAHVYVWGPKGADWQKAGNWLLRVEDPYAYEGVRSSAVSRSPWPDLELAAEGIGARARSGYWRWQADVDPGGQAALASLCMGSRCLYFSVADGEPISALRSPQRAGRRSHYRPVGRGVVRVGETWYLLQQPYSGGELAISRGRLGVLERVTRLRGLHQASRYRRHSSVSLVRRTFGHQLGVLVEQPADPAAGHRVGRWLVFPLDADQGRLGEPIDLGPTDLDGKLPPRCGRGEDGWLVETDSAASPSLYLEDVRGYVSDIRMRLRLDPGHRCADAMTARASRSLLDGAPEKPGRQTKSGTVEPSRIPLVAHERYGWRRFEFSCGPR